MATRIYALYWLKIASPHATAKHSLRTAFTIADKMRKKYAAQKGYIDKDIARKQSQLTQAEVKRANLYKLVENGYADNYKFERIRAAKETIETLQIEIKALKKAKQSKLLSDKEIERAFQIFNANLKDMSDVDAKKITYQFIFRRGNRY